MAAPVNVFNAQGNLRASAALAAATATTVLVVDASGSYEAHVTVENTPSASRTSATTGGVKVEAFRQFSSNATPQYASVAERSMLLPSNTSGTKEAATLILPTGKWGVVITNLDPVNATTVAATADFVTNIS